MPLYTLKWRNKRGPDGQEDEVFWAKNDNSALVHAAAATCITMEDGKPNLGDFFASGAKELRKGDVAIFPPFTVKAQNAKHPHIALAYAATGSGTKQ